MSTAEARFEAFAKNAKCDPNGTAVSVQACLRKLSTAEAVAANRGLPSSGT